MKSKETIKMEIGNRVKGIRESIMHMTKSQFAKLINMKVQYLSTVENGKRGLTIQKAIAICDKCNVSADYLILGINTHTSIKTLSKYSNKEISTASDIFDDLTSVLK